MPKFRKKPVVIEAVQFIAANESELVRLLEGCTGWYMGERGLCIPTLEGEMIASPGDWVIRGVQGECYPCKPDIFAKTYEPADAA